MRRFLFASIGCVLLAGFARSQAVPKVLLIQRLAEVVDGADINVGVRPYFAAEIQDDGRLEVICWAMSDPVFRKAVDDKVLSNPGEAPTLDQAFAAAEKLDCQYIFTVLAMRHQGQIYADAQLYKGKRQIWKGSANMGAQVQDQFNLESTSRTMARTWLFEIGAGPLKGLPIKPKVKTPEPAASQNPVPIVPIPDQTATADFASIRSEYDRLVRLGEVHKAIRVLRDAVDVDPLSWERRKALIAALTANGLAQEAALEAKRAAGLFPEEPELWWFSAKAAMLAGNAAQAIRDLNEAVSRNPLDPVTRALLGQAQLIAGRYEFAIEHFDAAIKGQPSSDVFFLRSFAYDRLGDKAKKAADWQKAKEGFDGLDSAQKSWLQQFSQSLLCKSGEAVGVEVRNLLQQSRLEPKSAANRLRVKSLMAETDAVLAYADALPQVPDLEKSHRLLTLALNLLGQSLIEVQEFFSSQSESILTDASISLGEALRALAALQETIRPAS